VTNNTNTLLHSCAKHDGNTLLHSCAKHDGNTKKQQEKDEPTRTHSLRPNSGYGKGKGRCDESNKGKGRGKSDESNKGKGKGKGKGRGETIGWTFHMRQHQDRQEYHRPDQQDRQEYRRPVQQYRQEYHRPDQQDRQEYRRPDQQDHKEYRRPDQQDHRPVQEYHRPEQQDRRPVQQYRQPVQQYRQQVEESSDIYNTESQQGYDNKWYVHTDSGIQSDYKVLSKNTKVSKTLYATKDSILGLFQDSFDKLCVSIPSYLQDSFDKLYVAVPSYLIKYSKTDEIDDYQLAVSGSIGIDGDWETSAWYECAEEIGVDVSNSHVLSKGKLQIIIKEDGDNGIVTDVYGIVYYVDKFTPPPRRDYKKIQDDKTKKVICWALFDSIADIIKRRRISSRDKAGKKVVIMTVGELKRLISRRVY